MRVLTRHGVDHRAQFVVAHTDAWPSGASWMASHGRAPLPFAEVVSWSPDPDTPLPAPSAPHKPSEPTAPAPRPAILSEVLIEVERTGAVLRLLPPDQLDWSPHPDIPSLRVLSGRLVRLVARIGWILELESVELLFEPDLPHLQTPDEIVETYTANEETVHETVAGLTGDDLRAPWLLERNGEPVARLTRGDALRSFGLTPLVYHRGELALLLTAIGIGVPHPYPLWAFKEAAVDGPA